MCIIIRHQTVPNAHSSPGSSNFARSKAIHYSPHMEALLHVTHAWELAQHGDSKLNDPITQAMLNGAAQVRKALREKLGTDLTQPTDINPLCVSAHESRERAHEP